MVSPRLSLHPDFKRLFEAAPGLYLALAPDLTILAVSDAYLRATGATRETIIGRDIFEVFPDNPDDPQATGVRNLRASLERVLRTAEPDAMAVQKYDIRGPGAADFEERHWSAVNSPVLGSGGQLIYIVHRVEDVTEYVRRRRADRGAQPPSGFVSRAEEMEVEIFIRAQQLQEANDRLRAANQQIAAQQATLYQAQKMEAVAQLTGGVAHDFNNLLTVIIGTVYRLEGGIGSDPLVHRMTATIRRSAERGAQLTAQLLAFSRQQTLHPETLNLNALVLDFETALRRTAGDAVALRSVLHPGLWPCNIDAAQFETAMLNIIANARDAMPTGGSLTIETRNRPLDEAAARRLDVKPGAYVAITVADSGIGMSADVAQRAFEPFFSTKAVGKGSGLGLSQVFGFVRQSGGQVQIDSVLGHGTTITLILPRTGRPPPPAAAPVPPAKIKGAETVLVVEDDPDVLDVAVATLTDLGYRILIAYDGLEALTILERDEAIDLLFTDIVMPTGISGVQLAREARRLRQDIKVLLTSGYAAHAVVTEYGAEQEFMIISKPYRQTELAEHVRRALRRESRAG